MTTIRGIRLRWLHETLGEVTYHMTRLQMSPPGPYRWRPAINAFQCEEGLRICVDLAGVDRSKVDLTVEPRRVSLRGMRPPPEPTDAEGRAIEMIAFEIDYGPFERTIELPVAVDVGEVTAEQRNGLLWIELPFPK